MHRLMFDIKYSYPTGIDGIVVPVLVSHGTNEVKTSAKLDTGCACCIFMRAIGEDLGLDIEAGTETRFSSVHGTTLTYGHFVTLSVVNLSFDVMVYFAADEFFPRNLLGRRGLMDQVKIGLVDYDGILYVGRYESE